MVITGETFSSETLSLSRSLVNKFKEHFGKRYSFETIGHLRNSDRDMAELMTNLTLRRKNLELLLSIWISPTIVRFYHSLSVCCSTKS